jgi:hypothetical protein
MAKSIAEAARAATAMEGVSKNLASSVAINSGMVEDHRQFWSKQMRAYVIVDLLRAVIQNSERSVKFEPVMGLINVGNTPAYNVRHVVRSRVTDVSIDDGFSFDLPGISSSAPRGMLGPRQNLQVSGLLDDFVPDEDVDAICAGISKAIYVWGRVEYTDVNDVPRFTNYARKIVWIGDQKVPFAWYLIAHNDAN